MNLFHVNYLLQADRAKHRCWSGCAVLYIVGRETCTGANKKVKMTACVICGEVFELEFDIGAPLICDVCMPPPPCESIEIITERETS